MAATLRIEQAGVNEERYLSAGASKRPAAIGRCVVTEFDRHIRSLTGDEQK